MPEVNEVVVAPEVKPIDMRDPVIIDMVLNDSEIRKLPTGSEAFTEAVNEKIAKANEASVPSTEAEETKAEVPDEKVEEKPAGKRGFQKRIDELVAAREAEKQEKLRLEVELNALRANKTTPQQPEVKAPEVVDYSKDFSKAKPVLSSYNNIEEYTDALTDWKQEKQEFIKEQKAHYEAVQNAVKKTAENWTTREQSIKELIPDYDAVVNVDNLKGTNIQEASRQYLVESEHGPAILYNLLEDEALSKTFKDANPVKQVAILAKLEAGIESSVSTHAEKESKATPKVVPPPAPPPKFGGKAVKVSDMTIHEASKLSFTDYDRLRRAQEQKKK